jgi:hypothetical protein
VTEDEAKALGYGKALTDLSTVRLSVCPTDVPSLAVAPNERLIAVGRVHEGAFQPDVVLEAAG